MWLKGVEVQEKGKWGWGKGWKREGEEMYS